MFLACLEAQVCGGFKLELLVADGRSSDGTRQALEKFSASRSWVRVIDNPGRIASTGLNAAIRASRGSIVIRMDAHTRYADDYVQSCIRVLRRENAAMVGGPMRFAHGTYGQNAIALAYPSRLFSGGSRVYDAAYNGPVDSALYGCWPRRVLEDSGLFDEKMVRNQDDELAYRIAEGGGLIWQDSCIRCWYFPRRSLLGLTRQFFGYGFWKVYTMRKHRTVVRSRHLVPAIAVSGMLAAAVASIWSRAARVVVIVSLGCYQFLVAAVSTRLIRTWADMKLLPALLLVFPAAHVAYGAGTLSGLVRCHP